jgi:hypothetical protein
MDDTMERIEDFLADSFSEEVPEAPIDLPRGILCAADVRRLTLFKWRYSLESAGFSTPQAEQLLFLKWLNARRPEWVR